MGKILYIVPLVVFVAAFCVHLARAPHEPLRAITHTKGGRAFATVWMVATLPVAASWLISASSGSKSLTARLADVVIALLLVAGFVKAVAAVGTADRTR